MVDEPSPEAKAIVTRNLQVEEYVLRLLDDLAPTNGAGVAVVGVLCDPRWLAIARTHLEQGFSAMNRAVLRPARVVLTEKVSFGPDGGAA